MLKLFGKKKIQFYADFFVYPTLLRMVVKRMAAVMSAKARVHFDRTVPQYQFGLW